MQEVKIIITTLSPVLISQNAGDPNMVATYKYIPARVIRGLFASEYIKRHNLKDAHLNEKFYRWFLAGDLKFTDAYMLYEEKEGFYETYPIPLSVHETQDQKAIYDLFIKEEFTEKTKPVDNFGYILGKNLYLASVKTTLHFHHARDRRTGTPEKGKIFNYEAIDSDQHFGGYIIGNEKDIEEFLREFKEGIYYIGRSRNNQYGKVKISFNIAFKQNTVQQEYEPGEILLTLLSDTIIYNEMGYPVVDVRALEQRLGCSIKKAFIKDNDIECFVSVWRLRTPSEISFRAGSCFLLEVKDKETLERLKRLMQKGIGERTEEGFGRFMLMMQEEEKLERFTLEGKFNIVERPPQPVQDIIIEALKSKAKELVRAKAVDKVEEVGKEYLTTSLLGRLILLLRDSENLSDFEENKLKRLRDLAKNKLKDTRVNNGSLYTFLEGFGDEVETVLDNLRNHKIINLLNQNPLEDSLFREELYKTYLETFLSTLIKEVKKK